MDWVRAGLLFRSGVHSYHHGYVTVACCRRWSTLFVLDQPLSATQQLVTLNASAAMMWVDQRYGGGHKNSEDFNTCGRTIKTGLIAVGELALQALLVMSTFCGYP